MIPIEVAVGAAEEAEAKVKAGVEGEEVAVSLAVGAENRENQAAMLPRNVGWRERRYRQEP